MRYLGFVIACFLLLSCQPNNGSENGERPTVSFWTFWSEPTQRKALSLLIREFEQRYHCTVEVTELSWNDGKTKLFAAFNAGQPPDLLELGSDWVPQFSSAGVLADLTDSVNLQQFLPFTHALAQWNGRVYAVPWVVDTRVLFYNRDLLRKAGADSLPPETVQKWFELSQRVHQLPDVYGTGVNGPDPHRLYKKVLPFIWSNGGALFDAAGNPTFDRQENIEAVEWYAKFLAAGIMESQRRLDDLFIQGKLGFWISGSWLLDRIPKENPRLNFGVALLPALQSGKSQSFGGAEYLALSKNGARNPLAYQLLHFLTRGENALRFCQMVSSAGFPADTAAFHAPYLVTSPHRKVFVQQLRYSRMTPVHPLWLDIEKLFEDAVSAVLYRQKSAEEALRELQQKVLELIARTKTM